MAQEPAKYVAKLREYKTDDNMLLFKCEMGAGELLLTPVLLLSAIHYLRDTGQTHVNVGRRPLLAERQV